MLTPLPTRRYEGGGTSLKMFYPLYAFGHLKRGFKIGALNEKRCKEDEEGNSVYIQQISTRRMRDAYYGGIGKQLHDALLEDAIRKDAMFIHLFPIDMAARAAYTRWGYVEYEGIKEMFFLISDEPSEEFLEKIRPARSEEMMREVLDFADIKPTDTYLMRLADNADPAIDSDKDVLDELRTLLEIQNGLYYNDGSEHTIGDVRAELRRFFEEFSRRHGFPLPPPPRGWVQSAGTRKTRRTRTTRRARQRR